MSQIASTMPEAKYRSTKKRATSFGASEYAHESRTWKTAPAPVAAKAAVVEISTAARLNAVEEPVTAPAEKRKAATGSWASWWPLAAGLFLAYFAPDWWTMAGQGGEWMLRLAFPLTLLAMHSGFAGNLIDSQTAASSAHLALYLQFPLEGLLAGFSLRRGKPLLSVALQLMALHGVAALGLWFLSWSGY